MGKKTDTARATAMADFNGRFSDHVTTLEREAIKLSSGMEGVRSALGRLESLKQKAARKVNHAIWLLERKNPKAAEFNTFLDARAETAHRRYIRAHDNAKKMSFLAKRAIEQRLGVRLADMADELPLVEAPQTWESTVCASSGIDLEKLKTDKDGNSTGVQNFADSFIGEYVRNLENVVESYRLAHNFHEGDDFIVASLRDDILSVRNECVTESPNLLLHSGQMDKHSLASTAPGRWTVHGCGEEENVDPDDSDVSEEFVVSEEPPQDCLTVERLDVSPTRSIQNSPTLRGQKLKRGSNFVAGATLRQRLEVEAGMYLFSWFSPDAVGASLGGAWLSDGTEAAIEAGARSREGDLWPRHWVVFRVPEAQEISVGFHSEEGGEVQIGAPMLERVTSQLPERLVPRTYSDTAESRDIVAAVCADHSGETFRQEYWTRNCINVCVDGYKSNCSNGGQVRCFQETHFSISQNQLAIGRPFQNSGFAEGNFNYRINDIGVNFVGTGIRNCDQSETPSACYSGGFVQYSLYHEGPFDVRNHWGEDFEAHLFPGRIERARGLALERYLSNPVSSQDGSLMDQYIRKEFRGRPLDGIFRIRVWEGEGIDFERIEDVQLLLKYHYWTRFN